MLQDASVRQIQEHDRGSFQPKMLIIGDKIESMRQDILLFQNSMREEVRKKSDYLFMSSWLPVFHGYIVTKYPILSNFVCYANSLLLRQGVGQ